MSIEHYEISCPRCGCNIGKLDIDPEKTDPLRRHREWLESEIERIESKLDGCGHKRRLIELVLLQRCLRRLNKDQS